MGTVIGPIDRATWYCMRQCLESINWCKSKRDPKYDLEIKGEQEIYNHFMKEIPRRVA